MAVEGGGARGICLSHLTWAPHIIREKTYVPFGVDAILQTPEWRKCNDERWHAKHGAPNADLSAIQEKRARIIEKRISNLGQVLVAENVLWANATNGSKQAHSSMLSRATQLAAAGHLRVLRYAVDTSVLGPYAFSLFQFDDEFSQVLGGSQTLFREGPDGPALFPKDAGNAANDNIFRVHDAGFDHIWALSGIDIVHGAAQHLGRDPSELAQPDDAMVCDRTVAYIEEVDDRIATASGWS